MSYNKNLGVHVWLMTWLWLVTSCLCNKRALTDYATNGYVPTTNSPSTLLIPTGQENVAAALLRASLMFDEEGLQYPYYDLRHNSIEKNYQENNYDVPQQQGGGHIQYYYQPAYQQTTLQPVYKQNIIYGTAKTEEPENGLVYGRPRDRIKEDINVNNNLNYDVNNYGTPQYAPNDNSEENRYVYIHPIEHTREEYSRAIAYHQYHPQQHVQQPINNHITYPIHIPSTPIYPTQPTYSSDLFRPSEELHQEPLQLLDRPQPSTTPKPEITLDLMDKPHLSTTKQQALLTQYFKNIQAQTKNDEQEEEEKPNKEEEEEEASRYKFGYRITDTVTGMEYGQAESREGEMTRGHYHVLLPDGRMQNVHYWSDDSGYHASISYDDGPRQVLS